MIITNFNKLTNSKIKFINKLKLIPVSLLILIMINCLYSVLILYAAGGAHFHPWAAKQLTFIIIFMPLMICTAAIDIKIIYKYIYIAYFIMICLLLLVNFFGSSAMGARRWLNIGFIKIQPAEPAKLIIILTLAKYFNKIDHIKIKNFKYTLTAFLIALLPVILIIKQPDLGTGVLTLLVATIIYFIAGISIWWFIFSGTIISALIPLIWSMMHQYQKKRVLMFLDPDSDPLGAGYNIIQSKIAIGSGGIFGKGLFEGTQNQLDFLPEHQTDFIFATLAEELGLLGSGALLLLYGIIIHMCISIALGSKSTYGRLLVIGITALFFFHIVINISMVIGFVPVVGIPLPLMSYGGTMIGSMLLGFGLIFNVYIHQQSRIINIQ